MFPHFSSKAAYSYNFSLSSSPFTNFPSQPFIPLIIRRASAARFKYASAAYSVATSYSEPCVFGHRWRCLGPSIKTFFSEIDLHFWSMLYVWNWLYIRSNEFRRTPSIRKFFFLFWQPPAGLKIITISTVLWSLSPTKGNKWKMVIGKNSCYTLKLMFYYFHFVSLKKLNFH